MNVYFTDVFEVDPEILDAYGAFNISLVNDLPLFVDPFLLFNSDRPEYQELHANIISYLRFLRERATSGKLTIGHLKAWFMFSEVKQNWLGFSLVGNSGSGLGLDFAKALSANLETLFSNFGSEQITKGIHLEKLCLVKEGVGKDNISDFTTNLIKDYLLGFTENFAQQYIDPSKCREVTINRAVFNFDTRSWSSKRYFLPFYEVDFVILTPKDMLTKDDTWINKSDFRSDFEDVVDAIPNDALRAQINDYFYRMLPKDPRAADFSEAIGRALRKYPELVDFFIRLKEDLGDQAVSVSSQKVKDVETLYIRQLTEFIATLINSSDFYRTGADTIEETHARILFLKDVIENKGGHRLFFTHGEPIRRESDLHILFRLTWFATPSDVSREVNDGRGPVDFKVSRGSFDKSLVEFKLAKNTHLKRNLEKQAEIYQKASDASTAFKVILYFTDEEHEKTLRILRELKLQGNPSIILIDAIPESKPSGSVA
ncbi:MAG: hypothetical protein ABW087_12190 [Candidatus Thiodiazotropha sp.]